MLHEAENCLSLYPWMLPEALPLHRPRLWREVASEVAEKHGLTLAELVSKTHRKEYTAARREAWALIYAEGRLSYPQIGARFGRDHTTILVGARKHWAEHPRGLKSLPE